MNDEARLIRKIQKRGDRTAADTLIRKYYDEIYRYVAKQTASKADAMDVTQEIFISVLKTIRYYDGERAGFRTWLYKIATNKTIDFFRSRAVQARCILDIDELELSNESDFVRRIEENDLIDRVCAYVNMLSIDVQQVFRLKFFGGYTFAQIAQLLHMPEATVKTKYYRLLNALRKEFHDEYH